MQPTLNPDNGRMSDDYVVLAKCFFSPKRGDVVVARSPTSPREKIVKRVIGLPGDIIRGRGGGDGFDVTRVPKGHCWLEGAIAFDIYASPHPLSQLSYFPATNYEPSYELWSWFLFGARWFPSPASSHLAGDNKSSSYDSNGFGPTPLAIIEGKALCICWPPTRAGIIRSVEAGPSRVSTPFSSQTAAPSSRPWGIF